MHCDIETRKVLLKTAARVRNCITAQNCPLTGTDRPNHDQEAGRGVHILSAIQPFKMNKYTEDCIDWKCCWYLLGYNVALRQEHHVMRTHWGTLLHIHINRRDADAQVSAYYSMWLKKREKNWAKPLTPLQAPGDTHYLQHNPFSLSMKDWNQIREYRCW